MHAVGHHLQLTAWEKTTPDRDAFARSAFNRYYYGVFLTVRDMVQRMDSKWSKTTHAGYPELLAGKIRKRFSKELKRAKINGDLVLVNKIKIAKAATFTLKELVTLAYQTRVIADYRPNVPVNFTGEQRFSLYSVNVTEAHNWGEDVRVLCDSILPAWEQFND